jgi:glycosyltransferase involved in cell wall biosynthesis
VFERSEPQWRSHARGARLQLAPVPDLPSVAAAPRRRVLVLAPRDPYPVIGGDRIRIHRLIRELAPHHDFTLVTFCRSRRERYAPLPADGVFKSVHRIVLPYWRSLANTLGALATGEPLQVAFYRSAEFRDTVEALAPTHDAVLAHLVRTAEYARHLPLLRILEMTDAISMNLARVASLNPGYFDLRRWIYTLEAPRMRAYERRVVKAFDVVSLTSQVDKSFLLADGGEAGDRMLVVPNGVDAPDAAPRPQAERNPGEIAFVGHMSTLQNYDAAWFFAHDVLPRIRARRPDAIFRIIGPIRPADVRRLGALPGVRVDGVVPNVHEALATARVGVCPTRAGSGIQNKVLDYFAGRLAVVCSPCGSEGIEGARAGQQLLIASSADEWTEHVLKLLDDERLAQRLADAGRAFARSRFRWGQRVQPLANRIEQLFEQRDVLRLLEQGEDMPLKSASAES